MNNRSNYKQSQAAELMRHARGAVCGRNFTALYYVTCTKRNIPITYRRYNRNMDIYHCKDGSVAAVFESKTLDELNRGGLTFMTVEKYSSLYNKLIEELFRHA